MSKNLNVDSARTHILHIFFSLLNSVSFICVFIYTHDVLFLNEEPFLMISFEWFFEEMRSHGKK